MKNTFINHILPEFLRQKIRDLVYGAPANRNERKAVGTERERTMTYGTQETNRSHKPLYKVSTDDNYYPY